MPESKPALRGKFVFVLSALVLFALHAILLLAAPHWALAPLLSNLIQIGCALVAVFTCVSVARRFQNYPRHFCSLAAAGFAVWCLAQTLATYYDSILHASTNAPWPSDVIFFLSMSVPFMSLFIDRRKGFDWEQWPRIFDLTQVIILMFAAYLFTFQTPNAWQHGWGAPLSLVAWIPESARDIFLTIVFALSALFTKRSLERSLFIRMAIFFAIYLCCEVPYLYLQAIRGLRTGTLWDLTWTLPFVSATVIFSLPIDTSLESGTELPTETRRPRRWAFAQIASLVFPIIVLLMAAGIAQKQLYSAFVLVVLSFGCSVARIIFAENEQLRTTGKLEESNALLRSVFEGTGDALFIKELDGRYVIVNQTFANLLDLSVDMVIGKKGDELIGPDGARMVAEQDRVTFETGAVRSFEYEMTVNGKTRCFFTNKAPYRDASGKTVGIIGVVRDVTEYRHMEERLRQSQKMEAIGTLAGGVAHDFNNLLMIINGYSSVLADALSFDHKLRSHADQIFKAGERAASLTRQLLAFSRKQTIQAGTLNLNQVISGMEKLLRRLIGENIKIATNLAHDLGPVLADAGQMEQVILNLAVNARDAMPAGGVLSFATRNVDFDDAVLSANSLNPGRYVEMVVSDSGIGMDLDVQTRLFEPFFTTKPVGKGTGLGLSTVYGILKQSGGHVNFTSQPGKGTTFRVYLRRTDAPEPDNSASREKVHSLDGTETVLLVEDDANVCEFVRGVLTDHGYRVVIPQRPRQAETLFEEHGGNIDLLLSDVVMPDVSGAELARRLAAKKPQMRVLFMSGYIGDDIIRQGIQEHEVPFLQKPFTPLMLALKVREVLDAARVKKC